jgi:hypothetical protein
MTIFAILLLVSLFGALLSITPNLYKKYNKKGTKIMIMISLFCYLLYEISMPSGTNIRADLLFIIPITLIVIFIVVFKIRREK